MLNNNNIYLASRSTVRRDLLKQMGIPFDLLIVNDRGNSNSTIDEKPFSQEDPKSYCIRVALLKAKAGMSLIDQRKLVRYPVLAADTTTTIDNEILPKQKSPDKVFETLKKLSNREHTVFTAVILHDENNILTEVSETKVIFRNISDVEIRKYIATGEAYDKSGCYGIQGKASVFIKAIFGSYSGVVGLPIYETSELMSKINLNVI